MAVLKAAVSRSEKLRAQMLCISGGKRECLESCRLTSDEAVVEAVKPEAAAASDLAVSATASSDWEANTSLEKKVEKSETELTEDGTPLIAAEARLLAPPCAESHPLPRHQPRKQGHASVHFAKEQELRIQLLKRLLAEHTPVQRFPPTKSRKGKKVARPLGRTFLEQKARREVKQLERARHVFVRQQVEELKSYKKHLFEMMVPPVDLREKDKEMLAEAKMQYQKTMFLLGIAKKELDLEKDLGYVVPGEEEDEYLEHRDGIEEMKEKLEYFYDALDTLKAEQAEQLALVEAAFFGLYSC